MNPFDHRHTGPGLEDENRKLADLFEDARALLGNGWTEADAAVVRSRTGVSPLLPALIQFVNRRKDSL